MLQSLSLLHVNRSPSQKRMDMRNVFIPFILLLPTRLHQRAYRTSHVQNPYTFHSSRSSSQGYSFKSPLLHHIVRMHIHTHPPVSSCTSDLFPFPIHKQTPPHAVYKKYSPRPPLPAGTARLWSGTALKIWNSGLRSSPRFMMEATFPQR